MTCRPRDVLMLAVAFIIGAAAVGGAQVRYDSPIGQVEILGLRRWTVAMLEDSVRAYRPDVQLHDAACVVVLRENLGFSDASVKLSTYSAVAGGATTSYLVIKLIEPADRKRTEWTRANRDTFRVLRPDYAPLVLNATRQDGELVLRNILAPLQLYFADSAAVRTRLARLPADAGKDDELLRAFLTTHRGAGDLEAALEVLRRDGNYTNRVVATAILANFAERDSVWYQLVEALRDPHEAVRTTAEVVLTIIPRRTIDWGPASPTLRRLLGGTNVAASQLVFETLARTRISASLARPLLRNNSWWIGMHLGARTPGAAASARGLLTQLHGGRDLGEDPRSWRRWIAGF